MTRKIGVAGYGHIGKQIVANLLQQPELFQVFAADLHLIDPVTLPHKLTYNVFDPEQKAENLEELCGINEFHVNFEMYARWIRRHNLDAVICALPANATFALFAAATENNAAWFDMTESYEVRDHINSTPIDWNSKATIAGQCGLAPGVVSIIAGSLARQYDNGVADTIKIRVGALPTHSTNQLKYALTWSTEGLISEYVESGEAIVGGVKVATPPLEGLEDLMINGVMYEAFNTRGGVGTLVDTMVSKGVRELNYKTIRFPGHCDRMKFLLDDLGLKTHSKEYIKIFNQTLPRTTHDQVVIYIYTDGLINDQYKQLVWSAVIPWSDATAIQKTTAGGLCGVVQLWAMNKIPQTGIVLQENIEFEDFAKTRFGCVYPLSGTFPVT